MAATMGSPMPTGMEDFECDCWRAAPVLAAAAAASGAETPVVATTHIPSPCVLEMPMENKTPPSKTTTVGMKGRRTAKNKPPPGKCRSCCRRMTAFLFSHIGLCALVIGYSIMGAFAFRALEAPYEERKVNQVSTLRQETVRRLWEITDNLNVLYKDNWTGLVESEVKKFQRDLITAIKDGYDGKEGPNKQWSFPRAFLYSLTVITTIGYGNIAPKTNWGKLVTIVYAIFGIPLMFLYLTNIGSILARAFKCIYGRLCHRRRGDAHRRRRQQLEQYQIHHIMLQDASSSPATALTHNAQNSIDSSTLIRNKLNASRDMMKDDDDPMDNPKPKVTVPITLCLFIIGAYICGGAALFSSWEGWDYLDGSYFCFVTLSTIGFGDLVPGNSVTSEEGNQKKLVICSLYLLTGMAIIAMCFNLVQEQVVFKLRKIGRSLGLLSDAEDEN